MALSDDIKKKPSDLRKRAEESFLQEVSVKKDAVHPFPERSRAAWFMS